jgi:DHA3 family macrolide efflux protein-like MFS transporter
MEHSESIPANWKRPFFTVWIGQSFSLLGSGVVQFAQAWWLALETGSATVLASATLFAILPTVLLGPFAGTLVDRWNRRAILILADAIIALATLGLIVLFATNAMQIWHIYAVTLIRALAGAFHFPAMQASTSLMVPRQQLSRVAGLNQTIQGMMNIVAPAVAGTLLALSAPMPAILGIDIVTAAIAIGPLLFIPIPQPPRTAAQNANNERSSFIQDMKEGLRYVWNWPALMVIIGMAVVLNFLLTPSGALSPLLVSKELGSDAGLLALMESMMGVGVIVGGVALSAWGGFKRRIYTTMMGVIGIGVSVSLVGLTPINATWLAVAGMFGLGLMEVLANGPLFAVMQSVVEPGMQGRVLSLAGSLAMAMSPLSLLIAGPVSDALGLRTWYLLGGIASLAIGVIGFFIPALKRLEDGRGALEESNALMAEAPVPAEMASK